MHNYMLDKNSKHRCHRAKDKNKNSIEQIVTLEGVDGALTSEKVIDRSSTSESKAERSKIKMSNELKLTMSVKKARDKSAISHRDNSCEFELVSNLDNQVPVYKIDRSLLEFEQNFSKPEKLEELEEPEHSREQVKGARLTRLLNKIEHEIQKRRQASMAVE